MVQSQVPRYTCVCCSQKYQSADRGRQSRQDRQGPALGEIPVAIHQKRNVVLRAQALIDLGAPPVIRGDGGAVGVKVVLIDIADTSPARCPGGSAREWCSHSSAIGTRSDRISLAESGYWRKASAGTSVGILYLRSGS